MESIIADLHSGDAWVLARFAFNLYPYIFVLVPLFNILACFSLRRSLGALSLFIWMLPGLLCVCGLLSLSIEVPDAYYVGSGLEYVGEIKSTSFNIILMLVLGWSFFTLLVHVFKLGRGFKDVYDHLWYAIGLSTVLIFVISSNSSFYQKELAASERDIATNLQVIVKQLDFAKSECLNNKEKLLEHDISVFFCNNVETLIGRYSYLLDQKSFTRQYLDLSPIGRILNKDFELDMAKFNQYECLVVQSPFCVQIPLETVRYSVAFDYFSNVALAVAPLHKTLVAFWNEAVKLNSKVESSQKSPSFRWYFFLLLSFVVGGKISNATRSLAGDPQPVFRRWLIKLKCWAMDLVRSCRCGWHVGVFRLNVAYSSIRHHPAVRVYFKMRRIIFKKLWRIRRAVPVYVWIFAMLLSCLLLPFAIKLFFDMPGWSLIVKEFILIFSQDYVSAIWFVFLIATLTVFKTIIFSGPFLFMRVAMAYETRKVHSPFACIRLSLYRKYRNRLWHPFAWLLKP